jgi:hypothetical protein
MPTTATPAVRRSARAPWFALAGVTLAAALLGGPAADAAEFKVINRTVTGAWDGVAPCLTADSQTDSSIAKRLASLAGGQKLVDAEVAGFRLVAQPASLVRALREITAKRPSRTLTEAGADCHDVSCAATAVFGRGAGTRLLLLAAAYRYNGAGLIDRKAGAWTPAQLDLVLSAFGDLPAATFTTAKTEYRTFRDNPVRTFEGPALASRSANVAAEAGEGQPGITVYPGFHQVSAKERRAIVLHEMAHEFTRGLADGGHWRTAWSAAAALDAAQAGENQTSFASGYAETNVDEDFAESVVAYRYSAALLLRRAPHRYVILRQQMFAGMEYGAASRCVAVRA